MNLDKWGRASSDRCECAMVLSLSHIANVCPLTMVSGSGLQRFRLADDDDAIDWSDQTAMEALTK